MAEAEQTPDPYALATARFNQAKKLLNRSSTSWRGVQLAYSCLASLSPIDLPEELRLSFLDLVHQVAETYSLGPALGESEACRKKILDLAAKIEARAFDTRSTVYRQRVARLMRD